MDWQATGLRRLDGIIWAVIASVAGLVLLTAPLYGFHLVANHTVVPASSTSWLVFLGLRDGGYRLLRGLGPEGIITFPSLHAALAVIIVAAVSLVAARALVARFAAAPQEMESFVPTEPEPELEPVPVPSFASSSH